MIHPAITLKHLETLVRVAQLRSFRGAAEELGTTQPNVSQRIATLEEVLGAPLFLRDGGRVRLTEAGERLRAGALRVLAEAERMVADAGRADLVTGRLRLGVAELVACTWLHLFLRRLAERHPDLAVELTVDLSRALDDGLARGALDLVLQNRPFASPADGLIELGEAPYAWVAARAPTGAEGAAMLAGRILLTQPRGTEAFVELQAWLAAAGVGDARLAPASSVASCAQMARDGLGLALLPRALVAEDLASGALTELAIGWLPRPLSFAARYRSDSAARHVIHAAWLAGEVARDHS